MIKIYYLIQCCKKFYWSLCLVIERSEGTADNKGSTVLESIIPLFQDRQTAFKKKKLKRLYFSIEMG